MVRIFLSLLALALAAWPNECRADFITPDSIQLYRPGNVGSADGSPVNSLSDLVTDQYIQHGLRFGPELAANFAATTVITNLDGVNVWASARTTPGQGQVATLGYAGGLFVTLAAPTNYIAIEVIGLSGPLTAFDAAGHQVGFAFVSERMGPNGGKLLEISAEGIAKFGVNGPLIYDAIPASGPHLIPQWGVAGITAAPALPVSHAPEPNSMLLALLGGLGLAAPAVRARMWRVRRGG